MNTEQQAARRSGRTVVELSLTLSVKTVDDDEAEAIAEQWMQSLHNSDIDRVKSMHESKVVIVSSWEPTVIP